MSSKRHQRTGSDWRLWWVGISVVLGSAVYAALAPDWVAFGSAALLGAVAVLLNHDRLIKVDSANPVRNSVWFAVLVFGLLTLVQFTAVNLSDPG